MKTNEFEKLATQLLPQLPGFVLRKSLIFASPFDDILRGLYFASSQDVNCFYFGRFFLPLFVPTEFFHVTYGDRLRNNGNQGWYSDNPNLIHDMNKAAQNDAMPFLNRVSTLNGILNYLKERIESGRPRVNSHLLEAYAYTLIKCGDFSSAWEAVTELKQRLEGDTIAWVVAQRQRARLIGEGFFPNPEAALQQLEIWKTETIRNLKLEKFFLENKKSEA